jgi:AraC-like DNA-binding protein
VLAVRTLLSRDGMTVSDVACRHEHGRGHDEEHAGEPMLVLVRRGCFVRSASGGDAVLDPTVAYCVRPGDGQRFDHPHGGGDDCTSIVLAPALAASLWGGDVDLPARPLPTGPDIDLEHRLLLAGARRGDDPDELGERALGLAAAVLRRADARRVDARRPATAVARRALADDARAILAAAPGRPLRDLAADLAVSPHHLSRVFRAETGTTIARHRMRLRARAALERLAGGERDLARLAADLGFADQPHLCRVVRSETGGTPAALRAALRPS